jgi:hypothetical protein
VKGRRERGKEGGERMRCEERGEEETEQKRASESNREGIKR